MSHVLIYIVLVTGVNLTFVDDLVNVPVVNLLPISVSGTNEDSKNPDGA